MEHILQFAVSIDENRIVKAAEEQATKKVVEQIKARADLFAKETWGDSALKKIFREEVARVVEENKDYIIAEAVNTLGKSLARTKAVKEKLNEVIL